MNPIYTIIPIFSIILLGLIARIRGFIPGEFMGPANRLVYYLAIPAMIFRSIIQGSFKTHFKPLVLEITLACVFILFVLSWLLAVFLRVERRQKGTFIQSSFHGNLGYIGLAVAYYYLGDEGLVKASILAGFVMILQNLLAVVILRIHSGEESVIKSSFLVIRGILGNPVVISAMAGILVSLVEFPIPEILDRSLKILSGMALPMALLLIGAGLSFDLIQNRLPSILMTGALKLVVLPGLGFFLYSIFHLGPKDFLPGLILLGAPTATITYVMAKEMKSDTDFAVATISSSTLLSALTLTFWIGICRYFEI